MRRIILLSKKRSHHSNKSDDISKHMSEKTVDTESDTCIESLVSIKHHLIDPVAKIVNEYTKNYKFKGKNMEKIDLSYTVCCDENKQCDQTNIVFTFLIDAVAIDNEIFILNNCFNVSVYNHIDKQITREFKLDLQCDNFQSTPKYGITSRIWKISDNEIKKIKMFVNKLNNEILLHIEHARGIIQHGIVNDDDVDTGHILVFNSLNGDFIRRFIIYKYHNPSYAHITFMNVTFDGEHLYVIDSSHHNGIIYVNIVNILDGSIVRKWKNGGKIEMKYFSRVKKSIIYKNNMYFVNTHDNFRDEVYICDAADGKNMRILKNMNNDLSRVIVLSVYDGYVYIIGFDFNKQYGVYNIAENNYFELLSRPIVFGLSVYNHKIVLHYGKMFLIKRYMYIKELAQLEKIPKIDEMQKSGTLSRVNDEIESGTGSNNEDKSCLDIDNCNKDNRIKISLHVIY